MYSMVGLPAAICSCSYRVTGVERLVTRPPLGLAPVAWNLLPDIRHDASVI